MFRNRNMTIEKSSSPVFPKPDPPPPPPPSCFTRWSRDACLFEKIHNFNGSFRLSNKCGQGYWWCFLTPLDENKPEIVVQANKPQEAIEEAFRKLEEK